LHRRFIDQVSGDKLINGIQSSGVLATSELR